ncbi:Ig-like domain-containing protein [Lachnospiraceae bacterium MD308]|nr:Ig-like domain-containing protein [Lachnospiraceae bacterium MD308]
MKKTRIIAAAVFIMTMLFAIPFTAKAATVGETVSQQTAEELKAIDYGTNETIAKLLAPSRYSATEKLNKKTEIAKREGKSPADITDEQVIKELNQDNVKIMSYEEAFAEVQANIEEIVRGVVDNAEGWEPKGAEFFVSKIRQNKEKLLLGITYFERLYDFNMGEKNLKDELFYRSIPYDARLGIENVLDWLIYIGQAGGDRLKISKNADNSVFSYMFGPVISNVYTLGDYLENRKGKWMPDTSLDEWFLQESGAYILERPSDWDSKGGGIYSRLYGNSVSRAYILPLLTASEDSVYVIANSATVTYGIVDCYIDRTAKGTDPARYEQLKEKFRKQLEAAANQQRAFIDFWHRIVKPEKSGELLFGGVVVDSMRIDSNNPNAGAQSEWSDKFGENASRGVREFFAPLDLYGPYMFADGVAEGTRLRYYVSKALTERGFATYAHELTHMLVSKTLLNGYDSRDGMGQEVYTRGMFEPYELNDPPAFNLNVIYDRQSVGDRYHNGQPERFQSEKDLKDYMSGILDVIYTLDYAEADIILTKTAEEKKKWFHKLEQTEDAETRPNPGEAGSVDKLDSVRELTLDEAKGLNTVDDLIRESIIVSRYEVDGTKTTGTLKNNGYYVVPLFSANYAGVQNDKGVSGDVMIRRQAFELLAEYGYYEGMVPYISNQYKESAKSDGVILSDQYILGKIFAGTYGTMADFKKAMFQRRIEKINRLKPVTITWKDKSVAVKTFEELRLLMKEAVESDLVNVNVLPGGANNIRAQATQVERLKQEIFKAYLIQTKDFEESIYGDGQTPVQPPDPEEPEKPGETDPVQPEEPETPGEIDPVQPEKPDTGTSTPDTGTTNQGTVKPGTDTTKPSTGTTKPSTGTTKPSQPSKTPAVRKAKKVTLTLNGQTVKGTLKATYSKKYTLKASAVDAKGKKVTGKNGKITWKSSNKKIATVNSKGKVTVKKKAGTVTITAKAPNGKKASVKLKVSKKAVKVTKVKITGKKTMKVKKSQTLKAVAAPATAANQKVTWKSSNKKVATVNSKGKVIAKKKGTVTITATARDGSKKKASIKIKVSK